MEIMWSGGFPFTNTHSSAVRVLQSSSTELYIHDLFISEVYLFYTRVSLILMVPSYVFHEISLVRKLFFS
jgi:hypothetical protein